VILDPREGHHA
jgi:hypothetical protein